MSRMNEKLAMRAVIYASMLSLIPLESFAIELPEFFQKAPLVNLPISVGRSSYDRVSVTSSDYKGGGSTPLNEEHYSTMNALNKTLLEDRREGIFSIQGEVWLSENTLPNKADIFWTISKISCPNGLQCFLLTPRGYSWLVVARDNEIVDYQLVRASKNEYGKFDRSQRAQFDSMFGEVGLLPYPETDYEKTGIFCSILTTTSQSGEEKVQIFKRRITPEGKIENKALPEGVLECKLPW